MSNCRSFYGDLRNWRVVLSAENLEIDTGREIYRRIQRIISVSTLVLQQQESFSVAERQLKPQHNVTKPEKCNAYCQRRAYFVIFCITTPPSHTAPLTAFSMQQLYKYVLSDAIATAGIIFRFRLMIHLPYSQRLRMLLGDKLFNRTCNKC